MSKSNKTPPLLDTLLDSITQQPKQFVGLVMLIGALIFSRTQCFCWRCYYYRYVIGLKARYSIGLLLVAGCC